MRRRHVPGQAYFGRAGVSTHASVRRRQARPYAREEGRVVSTHASVRRRQGILGHFIAKGKRVLSANGIFPLLMYAFGTNQRTIVFVTQGAHNVKCHDLQAFRGKTFMNYISGTVNLHVRVKAVLREPRRSKMLSPSSRRKRKRLPTEKRSYPPIPRFNPKCTTFNLSDEFDDPHEAFWFWMSIDKRGRNV